MKKTLRCYLVLVLAQGIWTRAVADPDWDAYLSMRVTLVLAHAQTIAMELGSSSVEPEHLAIALLGHDDQNAVKLLAEKSGSSPQKTLETFRSESRVGPPVKHSEFSEESKNFIRALVRGAKQRDRPLSVGEFAEALLSPDFHLGIRTSLNRVAVPSTTPRATREPSPTTPQNDPVWNIRPDDLISLSFCHNLTSDFVLDDSHQDPFIGREAEIEHVMAVLSRRTKNNAALIGEAGAGKTALARGLARELVYRGEYAHTTLQGAQVMALDLSMLRAGTKYQGELQERSQQLLSELKQLKASGRKVVLFLDEMHSLVGGEADESTGLANMWKTALERGELRMLGATTLDEYRKHIAGDPALGRRFQEVRMRSLTRNHMRIALRKYATLLSRHHSVRIEDAALGRALEQAERFLPALPLLDAAITVLDEAGARAQTAPMGPAARIQRIQENLMEMRGQAGVLEKVPEAERTPRQSVELRHLQNLIDSEAHRQEVLQRRWGELKALHRRKDQLESFSRTEDQNAEYATVVQAIGAMEHDHPDVSPRVTPRSVDRIIAEQADIPIRLALMSENQRYADLARELKTVFVGNDNAIDTLVNRLQSRTNPYVYVGEEKRRGPTGSFLLVGETGTGKTSLPRLLHRHFLGAEEGEARLYAPSMDTFSEDHHLSRLVGAPPGYTGFSEGGELVNFVRKNPYSVVCFDNFNLARARGLLGLMETILSRGELVDQTQQRSVSMRNAIFIATYRGGWDEFQEDLERSPALRAIASSFDSVIPLHHPQQVALQKIIESRLDRYFDALREQHGIVVDFTARAKLALEQWLIEASSSADSTPPLVLLEQKISRQIQPALVRAFNAPEIGGDPSGATFTLDAAEGPGFAVTKTVTPDSCAVDYRRLAD